MIIEKRRRESNCSIKRRWCTVNDKRRVAFFRLSLDLFTRTITSSYQHDANQLFIFLHHSVSIRLSLAIDRTIEIRIFFTHWCFACSSIDNEENLFFAFLRFVFCQNKWHEGVMKSSFCLIRKLHHCWSVHSSSFFFFSLSSLMCDVSRPDIRLYNVDRITNRIRWRCVKRESSMCLAASIRKINNHDDQNISLRSNRQKKKKKREKKNNPKDVFLLFFFLLLSFVLQLSFFHLDF